MIRMMATTISSSMSEKPFCLRISIFSLVNSFFKSCWSRMTQSFSIIALAAPKPLGYRSSSKIPQGCLFSWWLQTSDSILESSHPD
jgi:hypothetical protein